MTQTDLSSPLPVSIRFAGSKHGGAIYVPGGAEATEDDASSLPTGMAGVSLLGLDFADVTVAQAAACIAARPADAPFGYVVTPNADHLARLGRDSRLGVIYRNAMLCLLDSRVVFGLGRLLGLPVPRVVAGSDLTARLLAHHLRPGERVTIVGLSPEWLPALVARHRLAPPAHINPPTGFERDPVAFGATVAFVRAHPARFIFLAVGSPRQEVLAAAIAAGGGVTGTGLYRCEPGVPRGCPAAGAAVHEPAGAGMAVPACGRSAQAVQALRDRQPGGYRFAVETTFCGRPRRPRASCVRRRRIDPRWARSFRVK